MASPAFKEGFATTYETLFATFESGLTKSLAWRKWQLKQLWWLVTENEAAIQAALAKDFGERAYFETVMMDTGPIKGDVVEALTHIDKWAAGHAPVDCPWLLRWLTESWVRKEPLGVCLVIGAWNVPWLTVFCPAIAAIAAGNSVLLKPPEAPSASEQLMVELVAKYLDPRAIRVVTGAVEETTHILNHKFNHIFYTGGSKVGRIIAGAAARHLTPTVLELGGQSPAIVTATANLDVAAKRIASTKTLNCGQVCLNVNHVLVDPSIHDEFVAKMKTYLADVMLKDDSTVQGLTRIINERHYNRVHGLLENTAGNVIYGGTSQCDADKRLIHPSIVTDVTTDDSLMSEELFAPLIPVVKADLSKAIAVTRSLPHPLVLYLFSGSQAEIDRVLDSTQSGAAVINDCVLQNAIPGAPFGGVGESGYGAYHGKWGFDAFSHSRHVLRMRYSIYERVLRFRDPPYNMMYRYFVDGADFAKPRFRRGETMEDQIPSKIGKIGALLTKFALLAAVLAMVDTLSGRKISSSGFVQDLFTKLRG